MKDNRMMFFIFMLGTFTVGMAEYVVTGLLTQIASDMKVPISSAGLLISVYAISVALIGPLMRVFTLKVRAQRLLPVLMAIFIISNIIGMLASNFPILLLSRLLSASMHAPFFGVCMSVAAAVAPRGKKTTSDCSRSSRINNCSDDWRAIRFIFRWICELALCLWRHDFVSCHYYVRNDEVCTSCCIEYRS